MKNYADLAPNKRLGDTMLGIYEFRRVFDALCEYKGGVSRSIKETILRVVVLMSEAIQFSFVEDIGCSSFTDDSVSS